MDDSWAVPFPLIQKHRTFNCTKASTLSNKSRNWSSLSVQDVYPLRSVVFKAFTIFCIIFLHWTHTNVAFMYTLCLSHWEIFFCTFPRNFHGTFHWKQFFQRQNSIIWHKRVTVPQRWCGFSPLCLKETLRILALEIYVELNISSMLFGQTNTTKAHRKMKTIRVCRCWGARVSAKLWNIEENWGKWLKLWKICEIEHISRS